jgi:hypothetical protein
VFLFPENTSTLAKNTLFCHKYEFEVRARFFEVFGDDKFSIEALGEPPVHIFHFVLIESGHSLLHCPSLSLVAPTLKVRVLCIGFNFGLRYQGSFHCSETRILLSTSCLPQCNLSIVAFLAAELRRKIREASHTLCIIGCLARNPETQDHP